MEDDGYLRILEGDASEQLRTLADESVHCCVTSPPYWGLRDYGTAQWEGGDDGCDHRKEHSMATSGLEGGKTTTLHNHYHREQCPCGAKRIDSQLGLEKTPEEYVAKLVEVFREARRVLRKDGTLWLNLGDSFTSGGRGGGGSFADERPGWNGVPSEFGKKRGIPGLKPKDLCGIPWRVAFALQADGWWLRSDIIWAKPNPMPESVTDRPTKAHEYLFLLTKSASYFYDAEAIREGVTGNAHPAGTKFVDDPGPKSVERFSAFGTKPNSFSGYLPSNRNKRSVWTVATAPYPEAHFATYPPDLIKPCILSGTSAKGCCAKCGSPWERVMERGNLVPDSPEYKPRGTIRGNDGFVKNAMVPAGETVGHPNHHYETKTIGWQPTCNCGVAIADCGLEPATVLDPFAGSGTTGAVALELGRKAILIELNPAYIQLIKERCNVTLGLALA